MLNITDKDWGQETDLSVFVLFDEFIYNYSDDLYDRYYKDKIFCDSLGELYQVTGKVFPTAAWRKLLRFIPNVYKIKFELKKMNRQMELEDLRRFMLARINELEQTDFDKKWLAFIKQAPNHYEIIGGEVK